MRSAILLVCAAVLGACLFVRAWSGADMSGADFDGGSFRPIDAGVSVGLRSARECENGDCRVRDLRDFDTIDRAGELDGALASYAIGLAILAMLVAASLVRGGGVILGVRLALAGACALALIASIVFAARLSHVSYMRLGWAAYAAIAASIAGALTILAERKAP